MVVAIATGLADAGVASELAALVYGRAFVPLTTEHFDLVIPAGQAVMISMNRPRCFTRWLARVHLPRPGLSRARRPPGSPVQ